MNSLKKMMIAAGLVVGALGASAATSAQASDNVAFAIRVSDGRGGALSVGSGGVYYRDGYYDSRHRYYRYRHYRHHRHHGHYRHYSHDRYCRHDRRDRYYRDDRRRHDRDGRFR